MDADPTALEPIEAAGAVIRFLAGTSVTEQDGGIRIAHPRGAFALGGLGIRLRELIRLMLDGPGVTGATSMTPPVRQALLRVVERLERLVEYRIPGDDGQGGLVVRTMAAAGRLRVPRIEYGTQVRLSRFALIRSDAGRTVLESALAVRKVYFADHRARALPMALLDGAPTVAELAASLDRPLDETRRMVCVLLGTGLAEQVRDGVGAQETEALRQWDFHDLLFHARSRSGRHDYEFGAVYPYAGQIEPRPALRPSHQGPEVILPRPDLARADGEPSFTAVLEGRTSRREHGTSPITLGQLGEFLYRAARVRAKSSPSMSPYDMTSRPYPSAGAVYDLEIYLTVHRCHGLDSGSYHYDPEKHRLIDLATDAADQVRLLNDASMAAEMATHPDVLITLTSRFQRASWKYKGFAYALILKNVGVLYQTMYLVATSMRLSISALGAGDSDLAARAFHLDYLEESSVGELLLGSAPDTQPEPRTP